MCGTCFHLRKQVSLYYYSLRDISCFLIYLTQVLILACISIKMCCTLFFYKIFYGIKKSWFITAPKGENRHKITIRCYGKTAKAIICNKTFITLIVIMYVNKFSVS